MEFFLIIAGLFVISFLIALWSVRHELSKPKELRHAKRELSREKILYKR